MRLSRTNLDPVLMMAATLCLPSPTSAQTSLQDVQVSDIETMKEKVVGLAQEFDESQYDWRPVGGAPSVRYLFAKILAGCQVFPTYWGNHSGPGVTELQLIVLLPRAEMIDELNTAGDRLIGAFTVYRQQVRPFDAKSLALARIFADQSVIAIVNARLISETRKQS